MKDSKELLQRIAALRLRLDTAPRPIDEGVVAIAEAPNRSAATLEQKVAQGRNHHFHLDRALRPLDEQPSFDIRTLPDRLTAAGARLLKQAREMLHDLRSLAEDPALPKEEDEPLTKLHRETAGLIDVILRMVQAFPSSPTVQLRMCRHLEGVIESAERNLDVLHAGLKHRSTEQTRIDYLADLINRIAAGQSVSLEALNQLSEQIWQDAKHGRPLRFLYSPPSDPARFAAAHGLTTAQVMARILLDDPDWKDRPHEALTPTLIHDVGMARMPGEILMRKEPLNEEQRRLIERHPTACFQALSKLWPTGSWQILAIGDHHERLDGTGYPQGRGDLGLTPFVRLLSVCDVYSALACRRPHRPAFDTRTALTETMLMGDRGSLDPNQAEKLMRLGFHPIGSLVQLSDGAIGIILDTKGKHRAKPNPARPRVLVVRQADGHSPPLPSVLDLQEEADLSVVRGLAEAERRTLIGRTYPELA
ncbi:MAG: hypothetical protein K2X38_25545 [Gemmataceae bacterium]|nr:hypothetical protein [Gemmataceae bacterium]